MIFMAMIRQSSSFPTSSIILLSFSRTGRQDGTYNTRAHGPKEESTVCVNEWDHNLRVVLVFSATRSCFIDALAIRRRARTKKIAAAGHFRGSYDAGRSIAGSLEP